MKKILRPFAWLLTIACVLVLSLDFSAGKIMAAEDTSASYESMILDYEDLLTDEEEQEVLEYMAPILEYGNVIFQSVNLSTGQDYESYSEDTYYGLYGNEPGVILQIDMGHRKITLSSSTGLDDEISSERDSIVDNIYRYATDEDYCRCACECYDEILTVLNDGAIAHSMKYIDNALLAIMFSLIINFLIVFSSSKKKASTSQIVAAMTVATAVSGVALKKGQLTKTYSPTSSGSGGSSGGGGGGGGGGGFSGGSSSHGF